MKQKPLYIAVGFAFFMLAIGAFLFAALPSVSNQYPHNTFYVATSDISVGETLTSNDFSTQTETMPPSIANTFLTTATQINFANYQVIAPIAAGALVPLTDLTPTVGTNEVGVAISFKSAPNLAVGDLVDIFILTGGSGGGANSAGVSLVPLLNNVKLNALAPNGFLISVPASESSALLYITQTSTLYATLATPGNNNATPPSINSTSQAIQDLSGGTKG